MMILMVDIVCDIDVLLEQLQRAKKENQYVLVKPHESYYHWRKNHQLCVKNYELMKNSRKRIIKQRDKLLRENERLKKEIVQLEKFSKLAEENSSLYTALQNKNAKIQNLERMLDQSRTELFEYKRRYNLIQKIFEGRI